MHTIVVFKKRKHPLHPSLVAGDCPRRIPLCDQFECTGLDDPRPRCRQPMRRHAAPGPCAAVWPTAVPPLPVPCRTPSQTTTRPRPGLALPARLGTRPTRKSPPRRTGAGAAPYSLYNLRSNQFCAYHITHFLLRTFLHYSMSNLFLCTISKKAKHSNLTVMSLAFTPNVSLQYFRKFHHFQSRLIAR